MSMKSFHVRARQSTLFLSVVGNRFWRVPCLLFRSVCLWSNGCWKDAHYAGIRGGPRHHVPHHGGALQENRGQEGGEALRSAHLLSRGTVLASFLQGFFLQL